MPGQVLLAFMTKIGLFAGLFLGGVLVCMGLGKILPMSDYQVNEAQCTCDCFDRRLKGQFFDPTRSEFRAIYINWRWESWLIVCLAVGYAWCALRLLGRSWALLLRKRLSWHVLVSMLINSWGQLYNFMALFNYTNDRIYYLLPTQLFFVITQWAISIPLYILLDRSTHKSISPILTGVATTMALAHLILALEDQGFKHLFLAFKATRQGHAARDLLFLLSDLLPLVSLGHISGFPGQNRLRRILGGVGVLWALYAILRIIFPYNYA